MDKNNIYTPEELLDPFKRISEPDDLRYRYYYIRLYGALDIRKVEGRTFNYLIENSVDCRLLSNEGKWLIYACRTSIIDKNDKRRFVDVLLCRKERIYG